MASAAPPTEFFPGINFNLAFYTDGDSVTLNYVNNNFLKIITFVVIFPVSKLGILTSIPPRRY